MKRAFTQKVKSVPSCAADNDALAELFKGKLPEGVAGPVRPTLTEVNRRARTSAAMIGLAISMGASSLLLPGQSDEAIASEPVAAEPATATVPSAASETSAVVSHAPKVEPDATVVSYSKQVGPAARQITTPPTMEHLSVAVPTPVTSGPLPVQEFTSRTQQPLVMAHEVKQGQTIWNVSQRYQVEAAAIAAANKPLSSSVLPRGKVLKVPSVNGIVHEVKAGDTVESVSSSYGVRPAQLQAYSGTRGSGSLPVGESLVIPGNVNDLLKARQNDALNNLKAHRNRLQNSLAELGSEESTNTSELIKVQKGPSSVGEEAQTATMPPLAVEADVPMVTAPQQVVTIPSPGISPMPSPLVMQPSSMSVPNPGISPMPSPVTSAASPLAVPTSSVIAPNSVIISTKKPAASANPEAQGPLVVEPQVAEPGDVYQVKSGDTLDAIAQTRGVASSDIIRANRLDNPNLIRVNQKLAIPQSHSLASLNSFNQASSTSTPKQPGVAVPNLSTAVVIPGASQEPASITKKSAANAASVAPATVRTTVSTATVLVASDVTNSPNSQFVTTNNPYVEKLRAEILKLQEQYRGQPEVSQVRPTANVTVPTVNLTAPPPSNNASTPSTYINPAFIPNRYNDALQRENHSTPVRQPVESGAIQIKVPLPDSPKRGVVATSPEGSDVYNPSMQPPLGRTVSPDLPPLNSPDEYLPNGPNQLSNLIWPTKGTLTSGFGMRWGRMHKGIDIAAPVGTPVMAAAPGVVVYARWNSGGYGNLVDIQHSDGSLTRYAHNHRLLVREGQQVEQGQQISEMGSTGFSTGPHCHFEVHPPGKGAVNPIAFLPHNRG